MIVVRAIARYPVKGLSGQALERVALSVGGGVPGDRAYALARPDGAIDLERPAWASKANFLTLAKDAALAEVVCDFDAEGKRIEIHSRSAGGTVVAVGLDYALERKALEHFFGSLVSGLDDPPHLVSAGSGHFTDRRTPLVSLINLATLRDLEARWNTTLDPRRFRANLYVDGAEPWAEFDWVGRELEIGSTRFVVESRNGRCVATNVNPDTAQLDRDIPARLTAEFGNHDLGIYLQVVRGGAIAIGNRLDPP